MTREQENRILVPVMIAYQAIRRETGRGLWDSSAMTGMCDSFRAALRLDDPVLDELIASGAYKRPWASKPDRDRHELVLTQVQRKHAGL